MCKNNAKHLCPDIITGHKKNLPGFQSLKSEQTNNQNGSLKAKYPILNE